MDFTAFTTDGKELTTRLSITIEPIPTFTVTKGSLDKVVNDDGTATYTARFTLNPNPYFGNPQLQICVLTYQTYCDPNKTEFFTYSGNNNLSMSKTAPYYDTDGTEYFNMNIFVTGTYVNGRVYLHWQDVY